MFSFRFPLLLMLAIPGWFAASLVNADEFTEKIVPFLEENCFNCHDGDTIQPKGDFDIFPFYTTEDAKGDLKAMIHLRDVLHYHEMPPHNRKQPKAEDRQMVIDWLNDNLLLNQDGDRDDPGPPRLRRMTRLEYNNSVRDLLGLGTDVFSFPERLMARRDYYNPQKEKMPSELDIFIPEYGSKVPALLKIASLPGDNRAEHGFTNDGDSLSITPLLVKRYLAVASEIVNHGDFETVASKLSQLTGVAATPSAPKTPSGVDSNKKLFLASLNRDFAPVDNIKKDAKGSSDLAWLFRDHISGAFDTGTGGVFQYLEKKGATVPGKGGLIRASFGRDGDKALLINPTEDLWFVDFGTAHESSPPSNITNKNKGTKKFLLGLQLDGVSEREGILNLGVVVLSRAKQSAGPVTLTAHFANGEKASLTEQISTGAGEDNTFFSWYAPAGDKIVGLEVDGSQFSGDYVLLDDLGIIVGRVEEAEERTPLTEASDKPAVTQKTADEITRDSFRDFVNRAFRREVSDEEVEPFFQFYTEGLAAGAAKEDALAEAIRAVLTSSSFLFLSEDPGEGADGPIRSLNGYEIASRLSYFLWSTMPDDELFAAAESGELDTELGIEKQVERMLRDPKSKELSDSFAYQWLRLNLLLGSAPDKRRFPKFYPGAKETMAAPLLQETLLLFETCLIENRPLFDLIDPDFTWLNPALINFYGYEEEFADFLAASETIDKNGRKRLDQNKWFRCELPDRNRGGILCMGSTMTLTSLPLRTSPVYRGAWIAEVVLNRPPPPPPAMVDELGEDDEAMQKAGMTLRQKLELHREKSDCAGCHTRIDPLGFPLESFDPIGRWRDSYGEFPVDASGVLMNQIEYSNVVEFKDALAERKSDFHRGFVRHLLRYALGRHLTPGDEPVISELTAKADRGGLRDLILAVATCDTFRLAQTRK